MEQVISKDGTVIAYTRTGAGPAVILVDGAMCNSTFGPMPKLAPLLSKHFTVICYDRRGRGNSTDTLPHSPAREVEDIEALIAAENRSVYLFGLSSGAILSLIAAAKISRIEKVAIYEPPFEVEENNPAPGLTNHFYLQVSAFLKAGDRAGAVKYFLKDIAKVPSIMVGILSLLPMWKKMKAIVSTLPYDLDIAQSFTLRDLKMQSISTKALVAYGDKSPDTMQRAVMAAGERLPNSKMVVLKGQTHNVNVKVIAPVLVDFFKE